jgi:hypothetical protein
VVGGFWTRLVAGQIAAEGAADLADEIVGAAGTAGGGGAAQPADLVVLKAKRQPIGPRDRAAGRRRCWKFNPSFRFPALYSLSYVNRLPSGPFGVQTSVC